MNRACARSARDVNHPVEMDRTVYDVLADKGGWIASVEPHRRVIEAVRTMNRLAIGALLVIEDRELAGIFTERDVLTRVVGEARIPSFTQVGDVMSSPVLTIPPTMTVGGAMRIVSEERYRHLPVVDGNQILGMISIGDLNRWMVRDQRSQIEDLTLFITR